ncbi:hypothetical protein GMOD_00006628 [Pyrenophora seminiperda CCB06]|uniref:N-acetyltransferase domain-containing protein n=1 Tax=Pyrenophora seminiperda CCB06 TaxID=1302712 RepID=A0A3M7MAJ8_9PLEO|nr:hypothetical protein GMOD_00006628 [Pyrenophora seminiperda CCB06]
MTIFDFHITTPRLYISYANPALDSHCDFTLALLHGPMSVKWHPGIIEAVPDREACRKVLQNDVDRLTKTGYGRYLVSLRPEKESAEDLEKPFSERQRHLEHVGRVSMQLARIEGVPAPTIPDVGFNFLESYQGRGYAIEATKGLMEYFERERGVKVFAGCTHETNEPSMKLFRKAGFRNWGSRTVKGILWSGDDVEVNIWTWGVEDGEKLEDFGF